MTQLEEQRLFAEAYISAIRGRATGDISYSHQMSAVAAALAKHLVAHIKAIETAQATERKERR